MKPKWTRTAATLAMVAVVENAMTERKSAAIVSTIVSRRSQATKRRRIVSGLSAGTNTARTLPKHAPDTADPNGRISSPTNANSNLNEEPQGHETKAAESPLHNTTSSSWLGDLAIDQIKATPEGQSLMTILT